MNFDCVKLFEIPIYRCSPEEYRKEEAIRKEQALLTHKRLYPNADFKYVSWRSYRYNEIIGWVVIYAYERRVRAEYWFILQRVRKGLIKKQFEAKGKLFQVRLRIKDNLLASDQIFEKLSDIFLTVSSEWPFSKYFFDLECFNNIGRRLDWRRLLHLTASADRKE